MKRYAYLIIVIALWACNSNKTHHEADVVHKMYVNHMLGSISFDSIVDKMEYIQLESHPKAIIGEISDLIADNGNFYVISDGVYCFDQAGKFKYAINQRGKERSEFIECRTVSVSGKFVYIYDGASMKILAFDKDNGKYIKSEKIEDTPYRIYVNGDDMILDYADFNGRDNQSCRFSVKNLNTNATKYACMSRSQHKALIDKQLTMSSADLLFTDYYSCCTYKITTDSCLTYFCLDIPKQLRYSQPELDEMVESRATSLKNRSDEGKIIGLHNVHETGTCIYAECKYGEQPAHVLYNKLSDSGIMFKSVIASPGVIAPVSFITSDGEHFYSVTSATEIGLIKAVYKEDELSQNNNLSKQNLQTLMNSNPESNPIIIKYHPR